MKRLVFKKWVEYILFTMEVILFILLGGDCKDLDMFVLIHIITLALMVLIGGLLIKYGRNHEEER